MGTRARNSKERKAVYGEYQMKKIVLTITILMLMVSVGYGKAYFAPKDEMIEKADVIAIVDITEVYKTNVKGKYWTYSQMATANVEEVLRGDIPKEISIYGMEDFICAQCRYKVGKFLVFLKYDNNLLVGSNWHFSIRPIKNNTVEWYKEGSDNMVDLEYSPLSEALKEIKSKVSQNQPLKLTIKSDKDVYEVGEKIKLDCVVKNLSKEDLTYYDIFKGSKFIINNKEYNFPPFSFISSEGTISTGEEYSFKDVNLQMLIRSIGTFSTVWKYKNLTSNTITIEVVEKRDITVLSEFEGKTYAEIRKVLGTPVDKTG